MEYASRNIRVVATAPGGTDSIPRRVPRNADGDTVEEQQWMAETVQQVKELQLSQALRHDRRAGGADPVPSFGRGELRHRRHSARRRRRPRVMKVRHAPSHYRRRNHRLCPAQEGQSGAAGVTIASRSSSTHAAYEAGATLVHIHVRNDDEFLPRTPIGLPRCRPAYASTVLG